ncbi:isochorismatase family protein [Sulfurospirillum barnesii]|uniref:Nicotinamidase-like amidase n=1 Tax=Sulfurospirillum barnesii (strain ATCC 700032 / DSM 10660 / SES-3) TaxID=760154 RepID=I3Y0S9_SULBS|nr:isochorismatase family protein [Sulfurospirillum barnesii]AFL69803.1 nicotinamidase-like amidase [Sulfurospirillum barnesii SES-3]
MRLDSRHSVLLLIDVQEKLFPHIENADALERHLITLIKGVQALGIPIVCNQQYTKGLGATISSVAQCLGNLPVYEKSTFSCCLNEDMMQTLQTLHVKTVIVAGIESHICVQQSIMDLLEKGFDVIACADAMGSRKQVNHDLALRRLEQEGCLLGSTESILFEFLGSATHEAFKIISQLVK